MAQVKNKFDNVTVKKILKGLGLTLISTAGAFFAALQQTQNTKISTIIAIATGGSFLLNTILEYLKGQPEKLVLNKAVDDGG